MRLHFEQPLAVPAERGWPFISDPEYLNRWSTAQVRTIYLGDDDEPGAVGALRQLRVPARPRAAVFDEVIEHADRPHRFVYRVVGQRTVRYHRGEITLRPEAEGCRLVWDVEYVLAYPGLASILQRILEPQLTASLLRLAEVAPEGGPGSPPVATGSAGPPDESDQLPALLAEAEAVEEEQRELADRLAEAGDGRHWFARIYEYVTASFLETCRAADSTVTHRGWALRLVPRFHRYWTQNILAATGDRQGRVEDHWQAAFTAIQSAVEPGARSAIAFWTGLVEGARAHIEGDLARVLADVYLDHYVDACRYARFRADFLLLAPVFSRAWDRLAGQVPARYFPPWMRVVDRVLPPEAIEALLARQFWDPVPPRRLAFERGRELVEFSLARSGVEAADRP